MRLRMLVPVLAISAGSIAGTLSYPEAANAANRQNCETIVVAIKRQGGSLAAQQYLGRKIAWRESGCQLQCVFDSDDSSCSRFGINFKGNMRRYWGTLCNAWSVNDTKNLAVDVRCALRAFRKLGTRPWRT